MREMLGTLHMAFLVSLSVVVFAALFLVSLLIYMPVMALVAAPFTIVGGVLAGTAPRPEINTLTAVVFSTGLACATVVLVFRILLRRARARRRTSPSR